MADPLKVPFPEQTKRHTVVLPEAHWKFAKQLGEKNASRGIQIALARAAAEQENQCAKNSQLP